jgi:hypothetical protein
MIGALANSRFPIINSNVGKPANLVLTSQIYPSVLISFRIVVAFESFTAELQLRIIVSR